MKKRIPYQLLEVLNPTRNNKINLISRIDSADLMLLLKDKDPESDFRFSIKPSETKQGTPYYLVSMKPKDLNVLKTFSGEYPLESIVSLLDKWLDIIEKFNNVHTIFDDPIVQKSQEKFEEEYLILDEDANFYPFDLGQQIYIDNYLTTVISKVLALKEGKSDSQKQELDLISEEAESIKHIITKESKNAIVKRLSRLWALAHKAGLPVLKEVFTNFLSDLASKLLLGGG